MNEIINESIKVFVSFNGQKVKPLALEWRGRQYKVRNVNLVYYAREEGRKIYYFSVNDEANCFNLRFDPETLIWRLQEIYNEG